MIRECPAKQTLNLSIPMQPNLGDIVRLKKKHPCGSYEWQVVRLGADIGIKCCICNRRILLERRVFQQSVKEIILRNE